MNHLYTLAELRNGTGFERGARFAQVSYQVCQDCFISRCQSGGIGAEARTGEVIAIVRPAACLADEHRHDDDTK